MKPGIKINSFQFVRLHQSRELWSLLRRGCERPCYLGAGLELVRGGRPCHCHRGISYYQRAPVMNRHLPYVISGGAARRFRNPTLISRPGCCSYKQSCQAFLFPPHSQCSSQFFLSDNTLTPSWAGPNSLSPQSQGLRLWQDLQDYWFIISYFWQTLTNRLLVTGQITD